ncbi:MAG TPA: ABC transporter substrate-binding protein [Desulfomonilaceae bacterium]|nr:ABC transporter substrate-binding protein [Desulfomonilaceae bacterium]
MPQKRTSADKSWYTRREFLKHSGAAALTAGVGSMLPVEGFARATKKRDHILIGHPNPSTGPLADFGEATPWAGQRAVAAINAQGGIYVKELAANIPVKVKVVDTESDPTRAAEVASKLILNDEVDLMVVLHTPDTVNPVSAMCERFQTPCISLDAPVEAWLTGGPYEWCYHAFWTVDSLTDVYMGMWDSCADGTNKTVGGFWPNDADGKEWSEVLTRKLSARGYKVVDPGRFPYFTKDYGAFIDLFKREGVEIVTGVMIPPDWAVAWRQCRRQDFAPKMVTMGKAILFPQAIASLGGNLPSGLTCEVWWSPYHPYTSSLTGETALDLCNAWTRETGKQWTQPIGFKYAGFEIAVDVLRRAQSVDRRAILTALGQTDLDTIVGRISYNNRHYAETVLVGGQWAKGKTWPWELNIISNAGQRKIPVTSGLVFPLPR